MPSKSDDKNAQTEELAAGLSGLLADTYVLYSSTQAYHWNVEGPQFHELHAMFEGQYEDLAAAIDMIAERVRSIGFYTPGTLDDMLKLTKLSQNSGVRDAHEMLESLVEANVGVAERIRSLQGTAEDFGDEATVDMLIERLRVHEKAIWMLRSQAGMGSRELSGSAKLRVASS